MDCSVRRPTSSAASPSSWYASLASSMPRRLNRETMSSTAWRNGISVGLPGFEVLLDLGALLLLRFGQLRRLTPPLDFLVVVGGLLA